MVFSINDPTEVAIQKMIEAHRKVISPLNNPATNRSQEIQIATLEKAPRDAAKLEAMIRKKKLQKERANDIIETQKLVLEIEMLRVVLFLVNRDK